MAEEKSLSREEIAHLKTVVPEPPVPKPQEEIKPGSPFYMRPKLRILWALVIALVLLAGVYFQISDRSNQKEMPQTAFPSPTSTQDPTANWKTYESNNLNHNFSFRYPPTLNAEKSSSGVTLSYCEDPNPCRYSLKENEATIVIMEAASGRFGGNFSNNFQKLANELVDSSNDVEYETITVGGVSSVSIPGSYLNIGIPFNESVILINAQSANPEIKKTFPALLSSFKFTQ